MLASAVLALRPRSRIECFMAVCKSRTDQACPGYLFKVLVDKKPIVV